MPQSFTTVYGSWNVELQGTTYLVKATLNKFTMAFTVSVNDQLLASKTVLLPVGQLHQFVRDSHVFAIRRASALLMSFTLLVDGREIAASEGTVLHAHPGTPPVVQHTTAAPYTTAAPSPRFQILREEHVTERNVEEGTEEFPLDNKHGTNVLTVEYEISKTVSNEVSVQTTAEGSGGLSADVLSFLKVEIGAKIAKQTGHKADESITRRQKLTFSVEPRGAVVYQVVWKRKVRTGNYVVLANGMERSIPYQVYYDLSYEIRTL